MKISASCYSAIGGRDNNEDATMLLESGDHVIAIVADGLGGHSCGEVASRLAVKEIGAGLAQKNVSVGEMLHVIQKTNLEILNDPSCASMKTTAAVVWFDEKTALAATVGDTRVYQFRNRKIRFQSRDHSITQLAVLAGELEADQIRGNKDRNRLVRALGAREDVRPDIVSLDIQSGDAFLLCSDGFWEKVWEKEMLGDLYSGDEKTDATQWLGRMRNRVERQSGEGSDNHSAIALIVR